MDDLERPSRPPTPWLAILVASAVALILVRFFVLTVTSWLFGLVKLLVVALIVGAIIYVALRRGGPSED